MATCGYCGRRKGQRGCPVLGSICSLCCGEHRLKEIACPPDCRYLGGLALVAAPDSTPVEISKEAYQSALGKLVAYSEAAAARDIALGAASLCIDEDREPEEWEGPLILGFVALGYRGADGERLVDRFLRARARDLTRGEAASLIALQKSVASLYEVEAVRRGVGLRLKDLLSLESIEVLEVSATSSLRKWDVIFAWIVELPGRTELAGPAIGVPRGHLAPVLAALKDALAKHRRARAGVPDRELVAEVAWAPLRALRREVSDRPGPEIQTSDGAPLIFCEARYDVADTKRVRRMLASHRSLEETEPGTFVWLAPEESSTRGRTALATIALDGRRLILEAMSRERLERGKALLEEALGPLARHTNDVFSDPHSAMRDAPDTEESHASEIPDDVQREVLGDFYAGHYARWLDEPLPALAGKTPRQAVRTRAGKKRVEELVKQIENSSAGEIGAESIDFRAMRRALSLPLPEDELEAIHYDAEHAPSSGWLDVDDGLKAYAIEVHHRRLSVHPEIPKPNLHAAMHVIVENQLAGGQPPEVGAAVARLVQSGANRHEAIHAVGSVIADEIGKILAERKEYDHAAVKRRLARLRVSEWKGSVEP